MITKKEYAQSIVDNFLDINCLREFREELITRSAALAVAAEYLGLLDTEEMVQYAGKVDSLFMRIGGGDSLLYGSDVEQEVKTITIREMLKLLPEEVSS